MPAMRKVLGVSHMSLPSWIADKLDVLPRLTSSQWGMVRYGRLLKVLSTAKLVLLILGAIVVFPLICA